MANLSEDIQSVGFDTRPPTFDRSDFESWQQCVHLYCKGKDNGENVLQSIDEGPFKTGMFRETLAGGTEGALHPRPERDRVFVDLTPKEKGKENKITLERYNQHAIDPLAFVSNISPQQVVVQNVQGRQIRGQENNAKGAVAAKNRGFQNRVGNANPGGQTNTFDDDVDEAPVQDLALNEDHVFQADQCDDFNSDVDEAPTAHTMFMANLSSAGPIYDEASPSYDLDILSEVQDHDNYQDSVYEYPKVHKMHNDVQQNYVVDSDAEYTSGSNIIPYDKYVKNNAEKVVQSNVSFVPNDALEDTLEIAEITRKKMLEKMKSPLWIEAEVEQNVVEKQCTDIERKNLLIENENLITDCLSNELLYSVMNAVNTDTLEIDEITRKKMLEKMKIPLWIEGKIKIAPSDYSKENYRAIFAPQKKLFAEQIFWSSVLKPISGMMKGKGVSNKQRNVTLLRHERNFEQMEAEVEQNVMEKQCTDIERKNLLIENENLIADCLSNELLYSVMNAVNTVSKFSEMHDAYTVEQARCIELEAEISKLKHNI
nr:integrase, catalytic region, zinc finger, CCHC-type, peptidase aspartic, catalytic [Tanacetum cinerariifolium]